MEKINGINQFIYWEKYPSMSKEYINKYDCIMGNVSVLRIERGNWGLITHALSVTKMSFVLQGFSSDVLHLSGNSNSIDYCHSKL